MIRRLLAVLVLLLGASVTLPARAAEIVQVRGGEHAEGFARIAVQWPKAVPFSAKLDGRRLTIHFARAFTARLTPLAGELSDYVESVGQSADGTSITVQLKRAVKIRTATVNGRIATVDLIAQSSPSPRARKKKPAPKGAEAAKKQSHEAKATTRNSPRPKPDTLSRAGGSPVDLLKTDATADAAASAKSSPPADRVAVRGAEHKRGFARIAVEWPSPVGFEAKRDGATLTIHFARPFRADIRPLARDLRDYVSGVRQSADRTSLIVTLKRPVEIKSRTVNKRIAAIDLVPTTAMATGKTEAKPVKAEADKRGREPREAKNLPRPSVGAKKARPVSFEAKLSAPAKPVSLLKHATPQPATKPVAASAPTRPQAATPADDHRPVPALRPTLVSNGRMISLRFDWPILTGAAVYRRGDAIWIVFGHPTTLDLDAVRAGGEPMIQAINQLRAPGGTAVRLVVADGINPNVRRAGNAWIIDLKHQDAAADSPIVVDPRPMPPDPMVVLHVRGAGQPLQVDDPVFDDLVTVVPVSAVGRGIDAKRDFVDFRLLPSVQGIVIRPISDNLRIHGNAQAVEITRPHGLALSDESDRLLGRSSPNRHRMFDFIAWRGPTNEDFFTRRGALDRAIASAAKGARTQPRLDLAHFYFAHLLGPETLAVLAQISRDNPMAAAAPSFHALKGAACLLSEIEDCAAKELGQASLDQEPEIGIWRGSDAATKGDWPAAARDFLEGLGMLNTYPKSLRDHFALQAAETMLEIDRASAAGPLLDLVMQDDPDLRDEAMATYLRGRVDQQLGKLKRALDLWTKVAAMGDRKSRARALYAKAMALYDTKKADRAATIKSLDALRFTWRGDRFEFNLLRRLGELKLQENDTEGGLEALHLAAAYFPHYPAAKDVLKEAATAFTKLFTGKSAEDIPPVKALALYDQFHDLEPNGPQHEAIVKKLVDRLVSVDLLDRAARLLDEQVKHGPSGLDKARTATRLALVRLMNHQPDEAIAALDINVGSGLPPDLVRQRQELRARALLDQSHAAKALAVLAKDNSRDAYRLRADIYWHQRDWKNAVKIFALLAGRPPAKGPLDAQTAQVVLSWAAALTMAGDREGLAKLREDFGPAMAGTKSAAAFKVVAGDDSTVATAGANPDQIASRIAQIGALQNFMAAYKRRVATDKLSAIN